MSPTARSLEYLREAGYTCQVVEYWHAFAKIRIDLFGFIDILALRGEETLAVQSTSGDNVAHRVTKIAESKHLPAVRAAGWTIKVHGWRKNAAGRWVLREVDIS